MKKLAIALVGLLMIGLIGLPGIYADSSFDIDIETDGDVDIDLSLDADAFNATIILNGEDVLDAKHQAELAEQATHDLLVRMFMHRDYERRSQDRMDDIEEDLQELIEELSLAFAGIWGELRVTFHVIGLDHNSTYIVMGLKSGNVSVADYLYEHDARLNETVVTIHRVGDELQVQIDSVALSLEEEATLLRGLIGDMEAEAEVKKLSFDAYKFDQHDAMTKMQMELDDLGEKYEGLLYLSMGLVTILMVLGFHLWTKNAQ